MSSQDYNSAVLAKAMGATFTDGVWHWKGSTWDSLLFNPFTDANDDYAVLEWMRETYSKHSKEWCDFWFAMGHAASYRIGNYARAALTVLGAGRE